MSGKHQAWQIKLHRNSVAIGGIRFNWARTDVAGASQIKLRKNCESSIQSCSEDTGKDYWPASVTRTRQNHNNRHEVRMDDETLTVELDQTIVLDADETKEPATTPLKAVRRHCVWCCNGSAN
jgi:hypothetical protein